MTPSPTFGRRLHYFILKYGIPIFNQTSFDANRKMEHGKFTPLPCTRPLEDRPLVCPGLRRPNRFAKTWVLRHRSSASKGSCHQRIRVSAPLKTASSYKTCACRSITRSSRWFTWDGRRLRSRKNHNARHGRPAPGHEITEIEVVREKNPVFLLGESEDVPILQLLLTSIDEMVGVVATLPKEGDRPRTDAHVGQKSHVTSSTFSSASHAAYWRAC